jgi:hypothetical protein
MRRIRFSIRSLLVFILICGVAFAALKESTDWWERGAFSLTVASLVVSVLLAIHRGGERRAFWLGFALVGCCYLGLSLIPQVESRFISSRALAELHAKLPGQPISWDASIVSPVSAVPFQPNQWIPVTATDGNGNQILPSGWQPTIVWRWSDWGLVKNWGNSPENFVTIGHSLIALLLAWLGGILSRRLSSRPRAMDRSLEDTTVDPLHSSS